MDYATCCAVLSMCFVSTFGDCSLSDEVTSLEGVIRVEEKSSYSLWESVSFMCDEGYEPLLDDFISFCTDDGTFDPDPAIFSCLRTCLPPVVEEDTTYTSGSGEEPAYTYDAYSVVEFSCGPDVTVGYLEEDVQPFAYCSNGAWEPATFPDCKVSCAIPPIQNDTVYDKLTPQTDEGYIAHDSSIVYSCSDDIPGGTILGPMSTACIDGQFNDTTMTDCKVSCESPAGLEPSGLTDHGISINFTCSTKDGHIENGNDVTCEDGDWSKLPVCTFLCPGRDESYVPLESDPSPRRKRSLETVPGEDDRLAGLTAGVVAAVTTATAVAFVTVVVRVGDEFS